MVVVVVSVVVEMVDVLGGFDDGVDDDGQPLI